MNNKKYIGAMSLLVCLQVMILLWCGHSIVGESGSLDLWGGVIDSISSQSVFDWYSLSHIVHGIIFFLVLKILFPHTHIMSRLLFALSLEVGWEMIENSPWVIDVYRQQTLAANYSGDSILNSVSDTLCMLIGFCAAHKLTMRTALGVLVFLEVVAAVVIHDNLTLNIINFVHEFDFIIEWQNK
jgi:hypothetical protein